ncbi:hypothetical protein ACFQ1S_12825 [Kibdelosporangium lantanae]|uniref:Prevent-host-death family protein n=1 Tax=Kibdelosporangium lantanae TaxID=1497396 RepID=A0ABW3M8C7_9PSEU
MTTRSPEINFSELSNKPVEAVRKLNESPTHALRVHRRGEEEDLLLVTASRVDDAIVAMSTQLKISKLFVELMQTDSRVRDLVTDVIPREFPWVRFLPKKEVQAFVIDLVQVLDATDSIGNPAPVRQVIIGWQHTAEIYADPELLAALQQEPGYFGEVPEPPGAPNP